jgi:hypothetical protein
MEMAMIHIKKSVGAAAWIRATTLWYADRTRLAARIQVNLLEQ